MIISVNNLQTVDTPQTFLSNSISVGVGTLPLKSTNQFNSQWALQIGETGETQTEIVLLNSSTPSGTIGTITGTTIYAHPMDTPVYGIKYDQIVFQRSTTGTSGVATPMTNGTIGIMANGSVTIFDDTAGSTSYAYNTYFRNSALNQTSPISAWITTSGYNLYALSSIRQRIKDKLYSSKFISNDLIIDNWINEYLEMMQNAAVAVNQDYLLGSTSVSLTAGNDLGTISATDFKQVRRMWITSNGGVTQYEAVKTDVTQIDPNTVYDGVTPVFYMYGDNVFGVKPNNTARTANILYYQLPTKLVDETDALPVSLQAYSKGFVDYGYSQALKKDNRFKEAEAYEQSALATIAQFKSDNTPRVQTGPTMIRLDEPVMSEEDFWM